MFLINNKFKIIICIIVLIYCYFSWHYLTISNDALYQLTVLNNFYHGLGPMDNILFNKDYIVDKELLKWWSPLSYIIPFIISKIVNVSYLHAITICLTTTICLIIWILWKKIGPIFGLDRLSTFLLILCFVLQRVISISFLQFGSGDLFILPIGLFQFYVIFKMIYYPEKPYQFLCVFFLSVFGIMFKLNYVIYVLAYWGVLFFVYIKRRHYLKIPRLLITGGLVGLIIYFFSNGSSTPNEFVDLNLSLLNIAQSLIVPIIGVFYSFFSILSILSNIPTRQTTFFDIMGNWQIEGVIVGIVILFVTMVTYRRIILNNKIVALFTGFVIFIYSSFYIKGAYVGHDDRYFILNSILIIFYVYSQNIGGFKKSILLGMVILSSIYGVFNFAYRYKQYKPLLGSVDTENFGIIRTINSPGKIEELKIIGAHIEKCYPNYAVYTSNEVYFYLHTGKNPLIHDWNFQSMGLVKCDLNNINQVKFSNRMNIKGIVFITDSLLNTKKFESKIGGYYIYSVKNNNYD